MPQQITCLQTLGPLLAKRWRVDGAITDYDDAKQYRVTLAQVANIEELHTLLLKLSTKPRGCIIRGAPRDDVDLTAPVLRRLDVFEDRPSHLLMIDVDKFAGTVADFVDTLPSCFQSASYVWQLSGSHGHPSRQGLRAHLWFWLAEPLTCEQAEAFARQYLPQADHTVHRVVQPNYTANPVMEEGVTDPVPQRIGFVRGMLDDAVVLPPDMPVPDVSDVQRVSRNQRGALVDPREKPGVIGAFCRAFTPYDLPALFPEHFEAGSTPERFTWLHGGGSKEGLRITDSGTHVYNSHATAPVQRAVNLFDFIRLHVFGDMDADIDPEVLELDATAAPSYAAMQEWVRTLPEVQGELDSPKALAVAETAADFKAEKALEQEADAEQRIENLRQLIERAQTLRTLEHDIGRRIAKSKTFSDAERDVLAQMLKRRAAVITPGGVQIGTIRRWLRPSAEFTRAFPHVDGNGIPRGTLENYEALLARHGAIVRYNVMTKAQELIYEGMSATRENRENVAIATVMSWAAEVGMANGTNLVKGYLNTLADRNPYNPVAVWVTSKPWDGQDRLQALYDTVTAAPGFDKKRKEKFVRRWLVQTIAIALSDKPVQARMVLVFTGEQYQGKSRWVLSLAPEGFVRDGLTLDPGNKDSVKLAISAWIVELGELDATVSRAHVGALKAFLSRHEDAMRLPYAPAETVFQRRSSFFASVNELKFLNDQTGSSRYACIPTASVNPDHGIDMQQLWAQVMQLWQDGEPHWMTREEMTELSDSNEEFQLVDPLHEKVHNTFAWGRPEDECETLWLSATEIAQKVGLMNPTISDVSRIGRAVVKLNGGAKRVASGKRMLAVPVTKDSELLFA